MEKTTERLLAANIAVWTAVIVAALSLSACMTETGWQFQVGVHPLNAIDHTQKLGGVKSSGGAITNKDRSGY